MAEGHIEFTLSMCVCVCVCVCFPELCPDHNLTIHDGIENDLAQMIIMTRRCVRTRTMSLGQRSRSQSALELCA